jgi:hypothetical protein
MTYKYATSRDLLDVHDYVPTVHVKSHINSLLKIISAQKKRKIYDLHQGTTNINANNN